jgi:large subunit ribosomal protein L24
VQLVDPSDNRPTRVGFRREVVTKTRPDGTSYETSRSVRVSKRTGKDI